MIILTPQIICGLIGKMYIQLSMIDDKSISYMNGWMDTVYHYESALKSMMYFNPTMKEVPVRRRLFSLTEQSYDKTLFGKKREYSDGAVDANNYLCYHVKNCYKGK